MKIEIEPEMWMAVAFVLGVCIIAVVIMLWNPI